MIFYALSLPNTKDFRMLTIISAPNAKYWQQRLSSPHKFLSTLTKFASENTSTFYFHCSGSLWNTLNLTPNHQATEIPWRLKHFSEVNSIEIY